MSRIILWLFVIFILLGSLGCQQIEKKGCLRFFIDIQEPTKKEIRAKKEKPEISSEENEPQIQLVQHFPYKEKKCEKCHSFESENEQFLIAVGADLCFRCHKKELFQKKNINLPVALGRCNVCHEPHQSKEKALMKEPVINICLVCHPDFKEHSKFIQGKGSDIGACITCHNVHASDEAHLLKLPEKEVCTQCHNYNPEKKSEKMDLKMMYGMPKCVMCHKKDIHEKHLERGEVSVSQNEIAEDYARWRVHHPFEKPECKKCHNFSGNKGNILVEGGVTQVCLECHKAESIKSDNPKKDFLVAMYKMPQCVSCHKAVIHGKK